MADPGPSRGGGDGAKRAPVKEVMWGVWRRGGGGGRGKHFRTLHVLVVVLKALLTVFRRRQEKI